MTPELRQSTATRARHLQLRASLTDFDAVLLATEARKLFEDAGDDLRSRWLAFELGGYAGQLDAHPLSEVLHVPPGDSAGGRLVAHVAAYRTQRGRDVTPAHAPGEIRHFFVEPLVELAATARKLADSPPSPVVLLRLAGAARAQTLEFGHDVFARILGGFVAALHLQLGDLAE